MSATWRPSKWSGWSEAASSMLQHNAREPLQSFIARVDLESAGLQGGHAEQRFRPFRAIRYGPANDHSFELDLGDRCFQRHRFSVREYVVATSPRFEADCFEGPSWHERVERPGIDHELAGSATSRLRGIADRHVDVNGAHIDSPPASASLSMDQVISDDQTFPIIEYSRNSPGFLFDFFPKRTFASSPVDYVMPVNHQSIRPKRLEWASKPMNPSYYADGELL